MVPEPLPLTGTQVQPGAAVRTLVIAACEDIEAAHQTRTVVDQN